MSIVDGGGRLTLHLGVLDVPYRSNSAKVSAMTTGDVAEILEAKYGVMETFARVHQEDIAAAIEGSLGSAMESLLSGTAVDPWGSASRSIEDQFKRFIASGEAERVGIPGTPTKAALKGVSHRYKHPYARHPRRPSFRDTGGYVDFFKAWID